MAKQRMQQCLTCGAFSLKTTCPSCGERAQAAAPLKWSPEDNRAALRRKMNGVEAPDWPNQLATLPTLEAMNAGHASEEE
ncbi:MAG: nucleolar RNA-binding Nop10p family protein [Candidatus Poseidoniales archaeon]|jgi:rRNA maturation protein Nop10